MVFGLGLRFGGSMTEAIGACEGCEAAASAMSSFLCFVLAAIGNALAAPFVEGSIAPIVYGGLVFAVMSLAAYFASLRTGQPQDIGASLVTWKTQLQ